MLISCLLWQKVTLMAESEEELNSLLMKVKEESEKSWLKAQHSENEDYGIRSQWKQWLTLFFWAPKSLQLVIVAMKLKDAYFLER